MKKFPHKLKNIFSKAYFSNMMAVKSPDESMKSFYNKTMLSNSKTLLQNLGQILQLSQLPS